MKIVIIHKMGGWNKQGAGGWQIMKMRTPTPRFRFRFGFKLPRTGGAGCHFYGQIKSCFVRIKKKITLHTKNKSKLVLVSVVLVFSDGCEY